MTTIVIDEAFGATPIRDIISKATDDLIELRQPTGELVGTLMIHRPPSPEEYAEVIADAETDINELRRRAFRPEPGITTDQLLAKLLQIKEQERA